MARYRKRKRGRGGKNTTKIRRGKVVKWRKGRSSGYTKVKYPRRGKNRKIVVKKLRVKRR